MASLVRDALVDEILDAKRARVTASDAAYEGYRNHAVNFVGAITPLSAEDEEKVAIAAAFHDLHAFGLDYLEPSIEDAAAYLGETGREAWEREIAFIIAFHHRARPYRGEFARLVEPFPPRGLERLHDGEPSVRASRATCARFRGAAALRRPGRA